ncbi:MAG: VIT domain-containing protein [Kofleriaceae bacterium]
MPALFPTTPEGASAGAELVTSDGRVLALTAARLVGDAGGGIARLVLEQTFANHDSEILKVTYRMPLPADGAVSGYEFVIGERTVKGVVDKKRAARERFERAIASGHTAALLEQERAEIFTQQIGNIPAGERVVARITIDQRLAWLPEGEWELRFPTVIGPRYIGTPDSIDDAKATHVKVTAQPLTVTFQIGLTISDAITAGAKPTSPTHALTHQGTQITLATGARLDRDIVVRWPVAAAAPGLALNVARRQAGDAYGLITIVPPARAAKATPVARDLLVLLDTSGSMGGAPLDKAQQVVALMIDSLGGEDRLELIEFSDSPKRWRDEPAQADAKTKAAAIKWVRSRVASGGTEMRAAVIEALTTLRIGAQRQVVLVTDGYVGGEQQILEALHRKLPRSCRLHVLGVGSAVNRSLATALSRAGRGAEVIVGPDEDAERGAKRLLDRTKLPMLTNVEIAGSALQRHAPEKLPDVFEGAPLVAALMVAPEGGELVVRGQLAEGTWEQRITVPARQLGEGNQAIAALYGRERVADVEAHAMFESVNDEIEELGLMFQIATKMTSWVAVDDSRILEGPSRDELVPQELPYGTSAAAFGLRAVSAGFDAAFDLGEIPPPLARAPMPAPAAAYSAPPGGVRTQAGSFGRRESYAESVEDKLGSELGEFSEEEPTGRTEPELNQPMAARAPTAGPQQVAPPPQEASIEERLRQAAPKPRSIVPEPAPLPSKGKYLHGRPSTLAYAVYLSILIVLALLWYFLR